MSIFRTRYSDQACSIILQQLTMNAQTWKAVKLTLFEAVFVVLGVVLALGANEWREARAQRQQAQTALAEIIAEVDANQEAVEQSLRYHRALIDTLRVYQASSTEPPPVRLFSRGFVFPAQVYRTAWTSASETGALSHMDYADVLRFSKVYAQQDVYAAQAQSLGQIVYQEIYRGGSRSIAANYRNLTDIIGTFAFRERELVETYEHILTDPAATAMASRR